jgi:23S rRNA (adenine2030-N6)-methyltransferase
MNYRHAYHAGNFADVLKHIVLVLCLDYLQRKDGALCLIDAHGGAGLYSLNSEEAVRTSEWERGIGCFVKHLQEPSRRHCERSEAIQGEIADTVSGSPRRQGRLAMTEEPASVEPAPGRADVPADLMLYLDCVRGDLAVQRYPGSPLILARRLRAQDRLIAAELHEPTFAALQAVLEPHKSARCLHMDAYECIRAQIPPKERRGLVLIDPPFELKDEFQTLARQMREWKKRWTTGVFVLWYPIKAHLPVAQLHEAARELGLRRSWYVEALTLPRDRPESLNGCGLILFNAPFTVPERVEALLPHLQDAMALHGTASGWLVPGS